MRVATENLISIVPIFLLLALITSLLVFVTEQREVRWGLESEAEGLALAIAEFADPSAVARMAGGSATPEDAARVRAPVDRILALGSARRIQVFHVAGGETRRVLDRGPRAGAAATAGEDTRRRLAAGDAAVRRVIDAGDSLIVHAVVPGGARTPQAIVSVETSLAPLSEHRASALRTAAAILLALFVVGCLVSLALSTVITHEIGRLTRTARAFAGGDYDARLDPGPIAEVAEVGSTFGIMGSVLKDARLRSTREMLQFGRLSTDTDLAGHFAQLCCAPVDVEYAGARLAIDRLGPPTHGSFWFVSGRDDGWHACLGRIDQPASFDAALLASACAALLEEGLRRGEPASDLLAQAAEILPIHCAVLLESSAGGEGPIVEHRLRRGAPVRRSTLEIPRGRAIALSTLDEAADRQALRYVEAQTFDSPAQCVGELRRFFGGGTPGGVLVLQVTSR